MHIKKCFTDYYDWVEIIDPVPNDVVYSRIPFADDYSIISKDGIPVNYWKQQVSYGVYAAVTTIVVSDKCYVMAKYQTNDKWDLVETIDDERVLNISRQVGQPVFLIESCTNTHPFDRKANPEYRIEISKQIPILANYGFPGFIDPSAMYNTVDYFVRNLKYESPDITPIVYMTNSEKIVAHGFDNASFKHR
jgi:hypothetical protein